MLFNKKQDIDLSGNRLYTGRELFKAFFISGFNRKPVDSLKTHVKSTYQDNGSELPVSLDKLLEVLLVDGSFVMFDGKFFDGNILDISDGEAVIKVEDEFLHIFRAGSVVSITRYEEFDEDEKKLRGMVGMPEEFPADSFIFYPNGKGILYAPQKTLLRLEDILKTMQKTTPLEAVLFIQGGSINSDAINNKLELELTATRPAVRLAAGEDIGL